ncbi:hypothetical protein COO60DRAFT_1677084 [Scenedesmus sp. NREL 46B-D3]|nr:hypothetical protein COO60DRAFT_1677084 [Scenedesmus sp. NREL 46B-D3]
MSYSLGSAFAGNAVFQAGSKDKDKDKDNGNNKDKDKDNGNNGKGSDDSNDKGSDDSKDTGSEDSKDKGKDKPGNNGIGHGVTDNSGVIQTGTSQGIGYGATDRTRVRAAAVATTSSSDSSAWAGMRGAAWGGISNSDAPSSGWGGGFAVPAMGAALGGLDEAPAAAAPAAPALLLALVGPGTAASGAAAVAVAGEQAGAAAVEAPVQQCYQWRAVHLDVAAASDKCMVVSAGAGGRSGGGGAGRSGGGGGGSSAASGGGGGGGRGGRGRKLLEPTQEEGVNAPLFKPAQPLGAPSFVRQLLQIAALALLPGVDFWGLLVLGCGFLLVLLYMLLHLVRKRRATARLRMDPCEGGALRLAAARGDLATMQALADGIRKFHIDADHEGFTPLHAAAIEGKAVALLWLCQHGADVAAVKDDGWHDSALHYAAARGHMHCCQVLIAHGAQLDAANYAGQTAADVAARSGHSRVAAYLKKMAMAGYIVWRALRTLNPGWSYLFSVPIWCCEFAGFVLSNAFILSLWNQIVRSPRKLEQMLEPEDMPGVDIFVPTYSEPVEVIEPTVIAALNMNYPGSRMTVHVLDDGARPEVAAMISRLRFQLTYMGREAELRYVARIKAKGTPHHAKAGNINSALLKESEGKATFVLVLDCDMIVHPDFLQNILGHFYKQDKPDGAWTLKDKAGFIQTPQDFWNVDAADPLVHSARFFYGRDGIGACPCCGTGVVFRRDALISLGGQSYGSITEDYNTAMNMLGSGFATMFLNERLVFGMAPEDLESALTQRLRWAMGALQILSRTNPLSVPGLNLAQSVLFFEALAHHWLAIATVALGVLPIPFLFTGYSPVVAPAMWEFTLAFGCFYLMNRVMLWWVHRHVEGGTQEMWRGSQMWVWIAQTTSRPSGRCWWRRTGSSRSSSPLSCITSWQITWSSLARSDVLAVFTRLCPCTPALVQITFAVTSKDKKEGGPSRADALRSVLSCVWPYLVWMAGFAAGIVFFVVKACMGAEETEAGWKISWDVILHLPGREQRQAERAALQQGTCPRELIQRKTATKNGLAVAADLSNIDEDEEAMDVVPEFDDEDDAGLHRAGSKGSASRQGSGGFFRGRASLDVVADHRQRRRSVGPVVGTLHEEMDSSVGKSTAFSRAGSDAAASWSAMPYTVMEASSLYTHLILPEPSASLPGRAGGSQRLLAVTADGSLLPGGAVGGLPCMARAQSRELQGAIPESSREGAACDSGSSWSWVGLADTRSQTDEPPPTTDVGSFALAGRDADATVLQLPVHGDAAAADADNNSSSSAALVFPVVQGQLQQLATAVINKRVSMDIRRSSSSARRTSFGSFTVCRPAASAGTTCSRQSSAATGCMTTDMTGWTVAESVLGDNTAAANGCEDIFNTQAAVIPTLPENIYEHTIAAVPNFGARAAPKASWMFFIVNFVLLAALFCASFVEVYCD